MHGTISYLIKQAFDIRPELSDNQEKRKAASSSTGKRLRTLWIPTQHSPQSSKPNHVLLSRRNGIAKEGTGW
jgi:hypothetical protein